MIDYANILTRIHRLVRAELSELPFVEQATTEEYPEYPFATYTIINPYLNARTFLSNGVMTEEVEIVISYTWLSTDSFETNQLAQRMVTLLKKTKTRQILNDSGIVIVRMEGFGSRDNFISIETERRTGFDLRIRVSHATENDYDNIQTVI